MANVQPGKAGASSVHGEPRSLKDVPTSELISLLYRELRRLAEARIAAEAPGHTLTATALVHEVYLRLEKEGHGWVNKSQFFAAAAEAMRRVLVDWARSKGAIKRGGDGLRVNLDECMQVVDVDRLDWIALDEALRALAERDERAYRVVMLRFFGGLTCDEAAEQMQVSKKTANREWAFARVWLQERLAAGSSEVGRGHAT